MKPDYKKMAARANRLALEAQEECREAVEKQRDTAIMLGAQLREKAELQALYDSCREDRQKERDEARKEKWRAEGAHEEIVKALQRKMEGLSLELDIERQANREGLVKLNRCLGWIAHARDKHPLDKEGLESPDPDFNYERLRK